MSGSVRRILRAALFSLVLVPVCVVLAGEGGVSWRVRIPVIQPLANWSGKAAGGKAIYVADLKHPVRDVTITAEPFEPVGEQGALVRAVVPDEVVRKRVVLSASGSVEEHSAVENAPEPPPVMLAESGERKGGASGRSEDKRAEEGERVEIPSVSLVPSGKCPAKGNHCFRRQ